MKPKRMTGIFTDKNSTEGGGMDDESQVKSCNFAVVLKFHSRHSRMKREGIVFH